MLNELKNLDWIDLYIDDREEDKLALQYLQQERLNPEIIKSNTKEIVQKLKYTTPWYSNSKEEPLLPSIITSSRHLVTTISFISFSGVKSFLRYKILGEQTNNERPFWEELNTFYPHQDYDPEHGFGGKQKLVTCFNQDKERIFEGKIDEAPHPIKALLEEHDFKEWYDVSSWYVGRLEELVKRQDMHKRIIDKETRTMLFPDDVEILKNGKKVIITDSRSIYHVTYQACFNDNGTVYGLYAHMFD